MKKLSKKTWFYLFCALIGACMVICFIPMFVLMLVFDEYALFGGLGFGLLGGGSIILGIFTPLNIKDFKLIKSLETNGVMIKAKKGFVYIDIDKNTLKYKDNIVALDKIVSYEVYDGSELVMRSGVGEAIVGGLLFGGGGAIAGSIVGRKTKLKEKAKIFIKTSDLKNAGFVINTTLDNGYKLGQTLDLIMNKKEEQN